MNQHSKIQLLSFNKISLLSNSVYRVKTFFLRAPQNDGATMNGKDRYYQFDAGIHGTRWGGEALSE